MRACSFIMLLNAVDNYGYRWWRNGLPRWILWNARGDTHRYPVGSAVVVAPYRCTAVKNASAMRNTQRIKRSDRCRRPTRAEGDVLPSQYLMHITKAFHPIATFSWFISHRWWRLYVHDPDHFINEVGLDLRSRPCLHSSRGVSGNTNRACHRSLCHERIPSGELIISRARRCQADSESWACSRAQPTHGGAFIRVSR